MYKNEIKNLKFQMIPDYVTKHSYMLFFAYANNKLQRDKMIEYLTKTGIDARKSWTPIHMQPCNPELKSIKCVSAEAVFDNVLTLPIYNAMTKSEAQNVIDCCNKF
jgi:dTDP-4-amino-4,6-dideoxygalactose transaminase